MEIKAQDVKELRKATGAGILDCRKALEATEADFDKAVSLLREKGLAAAAKRLGRKASEGLVETYTHPGGRVGVMLEVNCETDFVARTPQFQTFVHDLALHIAAMSPEYMTIKDISEDVLEHEREIYRKRTLKEGKPEKVIDRIVAGRMTKFYQEVCLMEQSFVKDDSILIKDLLTEKIAELKENIIIRRFVRYQLGQHAE